MMEICTVQDKDRDKLRLLFSRAGLGAVGSLWGHEESEADVYLLPYLDLEPQSLFVAEVEGALIGYLAGCLESSRMPSESERMSSALKRHHLMLRPKPLAFFLRATLDTPSDQVRGERPVGEFSDARWPAHLHINIIAEYRGKGVGEALMDAWKKRLHETKTLGCYLQTLVENEGAVKFFRRMGFVEHGATPPIPGVRYKGRRVHQQTMVWTNKE
jgi:ribosomal protein S18 acetylase RimI-like enzyme